MNSLRSLSFLLVLSFLLFGCDNNTYTAPLSSGIPLTIQRSIGDPTSDDSHQFPDMYLVEGSIWETSLGTFATYRNQFHQVKLLYTKEGTLVCDYPIGFIGPIPYGHAREDGTQ